MHAAAQLHTGDVIRCAGPAAGSLLTLAGDAGVEWSATVEAAGDAPRARKFAMVGYTGAAMRLGYGPPVVVDLAGMTVPRQDLPILRQHDAERIVGHTDAVTVSAQRLKVAGVVSGSGDAAREVLATADAGFPWQASIGASVERVEHVEAGDTVKVNGRVFAGPVAVVRASTLREVSFVPIGADGATSASVAAQLGGTTVEFETWVKAKGFDPAALTDGQRTALVAAFKADQSPPSPPPVVPPPRPSDTLDQITAAARRENERRQEITDIAARHITADPGQIDSFERIARLAIEGKWDAQRAELEFLKLAYGRGPNINTPDVPTASGDVIEAAVCRTGGLKSLEDHFDERTLEAANKQFRHGLGLQELVLTCARKNGYRGHTARDVNGTLRAAFRETGGDPRDVRAASTQSMYTLSGILGNVANKFLRAGFLAVEQEWAKISAKRAVSDFKQITSYSLTGDMQYTEVGPGGALASATVSETSYTNQAKTYGKLLGIDRRDLINDDLGALTGAGTRLGRGGALKINDVFWTAFLNNSAFFTTGRNNLDEGSDTAFSSDGLVLADALFRSQTDPDSKPLGLMPKLLVVPTGLRIPALRLMRSQTIDRGGVTSEAGADNPWAGQFDVVSSVYMANSSYTGYSAIKWYLLADPNEMPVIETCFLNGVEVPTVETADMDFERLGIALRGYHDFGVTLQEYRGGVAMKGSA